MKENYLRNKLIIVGGKIMKAERGGLVVSKKLNKKIPFFPEDRGLRRVAK